LQVLDTTKPADPQVVYTSKEATNVLDGADKVGLLVPAGRQIKTALALGVIPDNDAPAKVNEALASGDAASKALTTIARFFAPGEVVEFRALREGSAPAILMGRFGVPAELAAMVAFIQCQNGLANLYFGVNPRKAHLAGGIKAANAGDVLARQAVVLDFDFKDAPPNDPMWEKTIATLMEPDPAMVVDSGNGVHIWFLIERIEGADLAASGAPLAEAMACIGSDDMSDLPRIIRLPFTVNIPNANKRARGNVPKMALPRAKDGNHAE
jgi:hypothetical protein